MELDTFLRVVNRDGGTKRERVSATRKGKATHISSLTRASKAPTQRDGKRWKETQKETEQTQGKTSAWVLAQEITEDKRKITKYV